MNQQPSQPFDAFAPFRATEEAAPDIHIGTPENPLPRPRLVTTVDGKDWRIGNIPTGANAQRSVADRWKRFLAGDKKDKDAFFPSETRSGRRAQRRAFARQQRKDQARYFKRELAKENAARDLLNLFLLADGAHPGVSPIMRGRANDRIAARVKYLRDEQQKAYDKAIAARQKDRSLPAPSPIDSHEAIKAQLWKIAQTAVLPSPKGQVVPMTKGQQIHQLAQSRIDQATGHPVIG